MSFARARWSHYEQSRLISSGVLADKPLGDQLGLLKSGCVLGGIALTIGQFGFKALEVTLFVVFRNPRALHYPPRALRDPAVARHGQPACRAIAPRHQLPSRPSAPHAVLKRHPADPQKRSLLHPAAGRLPEQSVFTLEHTGAPHLRQVVFSGNPVEAFFAFSEDFSVKKGKTRGRGVPYLPSFGVPLTMACRGACSRG